MATHGCVSNNFIDNFLLTKVASSSVILRRFLLLRLSGLQRHVLQERIPHCQIAYKIDNLITLHHGGHACQLRVRRGDDLRGGPARELILQ